MSLLLFIRQSSIFNTELQELSVFYVTLEYKVMMGWIKKGGNNMFSKRKKKWIIYFDYLIWTMERK